MDGAQRAENILWMNAERLFPVLEKVRAKLD
jgi:hypothetical protein